MKLNRMLTGSVLAGAGLLAGCGDAANTNEKPNVVIIFLDDAGWADFQPFGTTEYPTPNIRQLAQEGARYNHFYVPQAICSASRSALMTGSYPGRTKVFGAHPPKARGLDTTFATLGEVMQDNGYKTAVFGKWHLGDQPATRPLQRGFDEACGLMYSNDMWKYHPQDPEYWGKYPLQFWENDKVAISEMTREDQKLLTQKYTQHAVDFIQRHKDEPFFLYVPHSMPHVPIFCSDSFAGKSGKGLYADVMMELDWSVGEIMKALYDGGLEENTMVILTSDNGPWTSYGNHAGKTPFREAKATSFDGGVRSACIIKYPPKIKAGTQSDKAFCSIDILPSICELTGASLPANEIDGKSVLPIIYNEKDATNPHDYYAFSTGKSMEAAISADGKWKLHLPHRYRTLMQAGVDGLPGQYRQDSTPYALYDMSNDPYEKENVIEEYPDVADSLKLLAEKHYQKFYAERKQLTHSDK